MHATGKGMVLKGGKSLMVAVSRLLFFSIHKINAHRKKEDQDEAFTQAPIIGYRAGGGASESRGLCGLARISESKRVGMTC